MDKKNIPLKVETLRTHAEKTIGLIGKPAHRSVYFTTRWGIHTFGLRHSIDVLILDGSMRVRSMSRAIPPNRFFFWNPKYFHVIELPAGIVTEKHITLGTRITIQRIVKT